jgi:hypothetical protein
MKKLSAISVLLAAMAFAGAASAMDYMEFAKSELLKCVHPTTNVDKAKFEMEREPVTDGDVTSARVRIFYKGWVNANSMLVDIKNRQCGSINEVRAEVLEDSGASKAPVCKYLDGWQDL